MKEQKQIKKIEPVEIELEYTEDINSKDYLNKLSNHELFNLEKDFEDSIEDLNEAIKTSLDSFVDIGKQIIHIYESKSYLLYGFKNIYDLMQKLYNFSATTTKNYMAIAKRFEYNYDELFAQGYSISQLVEMSSMEDYSSIKPEMTIKEIRSLKRDKELIKRIEAHKNSYKDFFNKVVIKLIREELSEYFFDYEIVENEVYENYSLRIDLRTKNHEFKYIISVKFFKSSGLYDLRLEYPLSMYEYNLTEMQIVSFIKENIESIKSKIQEHDNKLTSEKEKRALQKEKAQEKIAANPDHDSFLILKNDVEREAYINNFKNWESLVVVEKIGYQFLKSKHPNFPFGMVNNVCKADDHYFVMIKKVGHLNQPVIDTPVSISELITFIRDYKTNYGKE